VTDWLGRGRFTVARHAGELTASLSRRLGRGEGAVIGGRVALALDPGALRRLARGRAIALVSGTNGKTTTSHLLAAVLRTVGPVAHNATGANMTDGAVAALAADDAGLAVLEVDELHVATVAEAVDPRVVVLGNLSRDQLDRGNEVRAVAATLGQALRHRRDTCVVANADDPMVVWAASAAARTVWVAAGSSWSGDTFGCPRCGDPLPLSPGRSWSCRCGLARPRPHWSLRVEDGTLTDHEGLSVSVSLQLPGAFNLGNAALALVAGTVLGADPVVAAAGLADVSSVGDRYRSIRHGRHELRMLMAKNPAGWTETLPLLEPNASLLLVINAREADGRDTSWLWDVPFERLTDRPGIAPDVAAAGERAHDLGLRLDYGHVRHVTVPDPVEALTRLPPGKVDVVANYTAFRSLTRRLAPEQP
jgi:UDP-N-acetylmuramyl tripeptide synthase